MVAPRSALGNPSSSDQAIKGSSGTDPGHHTHVPADGLAVVLEREGGAEAGPPCSFFHIATPSWYWSAASLFCTCFACRCDIQATHSPGLETGVPAFGRRPSVPVPAFGRGLGSPVPAGPGLRPETSVPVPAFGRQLKPSVPSSPTDERQVTKSDLSPTCRNKLRGPQHGVL